MFTSGICLHQAHVYIRHMFTSGVCLHQAYVYLLHCLRDGETEKSVVNQGSFFSRSFIKARICLSFHTLNTLQSPINSFH
jgi:hypothetical protein